MDINIIICISHFCYLGYYTVQKCIYGATNRLSGEYLKISLFCWRLSELNYFVHMILGHESLVIRECIYLTYKHLESQLRGVRYDE